MSTLIFRQQIAAKRRAERRVQNDPILPHVFTSSKATGKAAEAFLAAAERRAEQIRRDEFNRRRS